MNDETFTVPAITYTQEQGLSDKTRRFKHNTCFWGTIHDFSRQKTGLQFWVYVLFDRNALCLVELKRFCQIFWDLRTDDSLRLLTATDTPPLSKYILNMQMPIIFSFPFICLPWLSFVVTFSVTIWQLSIPTTVQTFVTLLQHLQIFDTPDHKYECKTTGMSCVPTLLCKT